MPDRQQEINELYALMQREPEVKEVVNMVMAKEGVDLFGLAENGPLFEALYDECFSVQAQIEDDIGFIE